MRVSVIIPAYNEADRIAATVTALSVLPEIEEILVVDDGSKDATAESARRAGARVVLIPTNSGKGHALSVGMSSATGDLLLMLDADLGESVGEAGKLLTPILNGSADMTIATFPVIPGKGGGFGFVVRLARWGIARSTGQTMAAPLSGQRALRRAVWEKIGGFAPGFGAEVALTIDTLCAGFQVVEVPTTMTHRVTGRDWKAIRHRARQFWAVARVLWSRRGARCG
jgi:glycosyltransferase involved in cell wall biosynthesis